MGSSTARGGGRGGVVDEWFEIEGLEAFTVKGVELPDDALEAYEGLGVIHPDGETFTYVPNTSMAGEVLHANIVAALGETARYDEFTRVTKDGNEFDFDAVRMGWRGGRMPSARLARDRRAMGKLRSVARRLQRAGWDDVIITYWPTEGSQVSLPIEDWF